MFITWVGPELDPSSPILHRRHILQMSGPCFMLGLCMIGFRSLFSCGPYIMLALCMSRIRSLLSYITPQFMHG
jgi:hypothetical protein